MGRGDIKLIPIDVKNIEIGKPSDVDFSLFWEAWNELVNRAVQEPDKQKMLEGAISGVLSSVDDPYTMYFTKIENKQFLEDIQGEFSGIGIEITLRDGLPTVVAPLSNTPADEAGIKAGDIILEVDGESTSELGFDEIINRIRGEKGTKVKLKILRDSASETLDFEVIRNKIVVKSVEWEMKEAAGKRFYHIKMRQFGDDTEALFSQLAKEIKENGADGIILDLRNNPGGYLETAVNISSYFIEDGVIVSETGKNDEKKDYNAKGNAKLKDFNIVVLTNEGSASASEIVAGALRDRKGVKIIGQKTFGKGSVQELVELSDGSAVKITTASWFTPSGKQINGEGLEPDIAIEDNEETEKDEQLEKAIEYLE